MMVKKFILKFFLGCIKIADFGFSKLLGEEDWAETMLGSPLNMAPEGIYLEKSLKIKI